ncbi:MAG: DUF6273 domain-containing protein [Oscillospiraceae bacterium]|nr:DUF6273 domain-containing protein [Oscillospiraceae bacterium]
MKCLKCGQEVPSDREICPNNNCYIPIKPIPIPPGGKIRFGAYDWYVLDKQDDRALILTEKVIERRAYHKQVCEITWEMCDMRKYLNGEFYNSFSAVNRERIIEVVNENNENPWFGTSGGNPTKDKIFLLSIDEVMKYFGDSGQCENRPKSDDYSWCNDEYWPWLNDQYDINRRAVDDTGMVVAWRLRSPGATGRLAAIVMGNCDDEFDHGGIGMSGGGEELSTERLFLYDVSDKWVTEVLDDSHNTNGVRPALWLRMS